MKNIGIFRGHIYDPAPVPEAKALAGASLKLDGASVRRAARGRFRALAATAAQLDNRSRKAW